MSKGAHRSTTLPSEAYVIIMECVYRMSQGKDVDYKTLVACALVCRDWVSTAQRLLFRRLPAATGQLQRDAFKALIATIDEKPILGTYARALTIDAVRERRYRGWNDHTPDDELLQDAITLLGLCPHVSALHILTDLANIGWSPATQERLQALALPITSLSLKDSAASARALLALFPSVRTFTALRLFSDSGPPPAALAGTLAAVEMAENIGVRHMAWLLSLADDASALRELAVRWPIWGQAELIRGLADGFSLSPIRSLMTVSTPPPAVLAMLVNLEEYITTVLPGGALALPTSVRHVGYHPPYQTVFLKKEAMAHFTDALVGLPELRLVSATSCVHAGTIKHIEEATRARGVDFVTYFPVERSHYVDWL